MLTWLLIDTIVRDPSCQFRELIRERIVDEYADAIREGIQLPAVTVFRDGDRDYLADGFHRLAAAELAGETHIAADVRPGTLRQAILHAVGANAEHGLRRTTEEKRRAVQALLNDSEWTQKSDRWIAEVAHVSHTFVAKCRRGDVIQLLKSSDCWEWYTPRPYTDAARELMGGIDLDPASSERANDRVGASAIYDVTQNGLEHDWRGRVWCNPPGGKERGESRIGLFTYKLLRHYDARDVTQACLLIPATTDTAHFQACQNHPVCLIDGRVNFDFGHPDEEKAGNNTQAHCVVYMGDQPKRFREIFGQFGPVFSTRW